MRIYSELSWDERGVPRVETLEELELSEFKHLLELIEI